MKKTIPINIAEILFHIEEDAYQELADYLKSVKEYFLRYPEHDEIVSDIERRIAEQFTGNGNKDKIVNKGDVERVIATMGKVEDFAHDGMDDTTHNDSASGKKLFRNGDDTVIGGVASGIAAFFGLSALLVRILFVVVCLFGGYGILFYIILWFIIPEAKTSSDKIRMRGGKVTLAAVERSVKDKVEELKIHRSKLYKVASALGRVIRALALMFYKLIKLLIRVLGFVLMLAGSITLIALAIALVSLILNINSPYIDFPIRDALTGWEYYLSLFTAFFLVSVPVAYLAMIGKSVMRFKNSFNRSISLGLLAVWLAAVIFGGALAIRVVPKIHAAVENSPALETVSQNYDLKDFASVSVGDANTLEIIQGKKFAILATGHQADLDDMVFVNDNGTLKISDHEAFKICLFCFRDNVHVQVTMPAVDHISASGASRVTATSISQNDLDVTLSGASRATLGATLKNLTAELSGASRLDITGSTQTMNAKLSGASHLQGPDFVIAEAIANGSGASHLTLNVLKTLTAKLSGASRIEYSGTPKVESELSGSSRVSPVNSEEVE